MNKSKPILIVAGEPFSIFLEIFFKSKTIKSLKKKIVLIVSKKLLLSQMKSLNFDFQINEIDPKKIIIKLGEFIVAENGKISENYNEEKLQEYMKWDSILIEVDLKQGPEQYECYTCDFTHDYIDINANYRRS